ncbi:MAG: 50S ribosomal protein L1 [Opitutales bacterium]|nr:50S ribosomal protein L1 [Opitutales bacterium]NRA28105.1 50S ribosomal protein L1 [Opitutales bacterium]
MVKLSKRYQKALEVGDLTQGYSLEEAVNLLKQMPSPKFDETIELSAHLHVDPRQSDQMVRGTVSLPHGSGRKVVVLAFTDKPEEAIAAGADFAGLEDMIAKVQDGWIDFDKAIATPAAMKLVRSVARVLGPRGLMPNPKSGTVTDDLAAGIQAVKAGQVEYKMDKTANISVVCGKKSFGNEQIVENVKTAIDSIGKARPEAFAGRYIKSMAVSASMSPSVKLESTVFGSF